MGMSLGSKNPIWDPIVLNGRCIGHKHIKTGIIVIDNPKLDPDVPGWEIKPPIARLYYKETKMCDDAPFAPLDDAKLPSWSNNAADAGVLTEEALAEAFLQIRQFRGVLQPVKEGPYPPHLIAQMSDEPAPAKPFGEAVADSWRGIKDWYNGPETSQKTDPSVREHVNAEVDRQIKASEKQKPFPGILP